MATQTVEFRAATGLSVTAKLFAAGSDTEVASVSATEATNRKGTYLAAFTDVVAGDYLLIALSSGSPVASWWVSLTLATATFQACDQSNAVIAAAVRVNLATELARIDVAVSTRATPNDVEISVAPHSATESERQRGTTIHRATGDRSDIEIRSIVDANGDPVDLSEKTLALYVETTDATPVHVQTVANADIDVFGTSNDSIRFPPNSSLYGTARTLRWNLHVVSDDYKEEIFGSIVLRRSAISSATL